MKALLKIVFFLLGWIGCVTTTLADTHLYDDSRGLSNSQVNKLVKDRTGLLWIATGMGLNSFDGYTFKEVAFFKSYAINTICYDTVHHEMLVGTQNGLFKFNLSTYQVTTVSIQKQASQVLFIYAVNHTFIVQFLDGLIARLTPTNTLEPIFRLQQIGLKNGLYRSISCITESGELYLSAHDYPHVFKLNVHTKKHTILSGVLAKDIWSLALFDGQKVIACMRKGLVQLSENSQDWICKSPENQAERFNYIYKFKEEYYALFRGFYGVYKLDRPTQKWILLESDYDVSFRSKNITNMYRDAYNVLWVATNKGLIKMTLKPRSKFNTLFVGYLPFVSTRQMLPISKNELFVATINGVYSYKLNTLKATLIDSTLNDSVFPMYTRSLCLAPDGYVYAGTETQDHFLYRIHPIKQQSEGNFYTVHPKGIKISSVYAILKGKGSLLWLATDKGLATYDWQSKQVTLLQSGNFNTGSIRLFHLAHSTTKGKFWAAGRGGLFLIDEHNGIELQLSPGKLPFKLIDDDYIFVGEDVRHKVWVATKKSGMMVLDLKKQQTDFLTKSNGLSANEVYGVLWQDNNVGWISTVHGLCRYDVTSRTFNNYFLEDGLSDNEFNQNSLFQSSDGVFYFGGINGVNYFNPNMVQPITEKLTIFNASAVKWNESNQSFEQVNPDQTIVMNAHDHLLTFNFGLSDYSNVEACTYFYKIQGLYNDWVSLGNQNVLRLNALPAGTYQVEVIGYNKRGIRSSNVLSYQIYITQVFYKTWWFYVILALGVVVLVYGYFKWRIQNIQQKLKLRTQIASNLHDEVGSLLTSIIISTDSARYSASSDEEKNAKLEKISLLSREATNTMSDVLWSIDARNDYIGNLTDRMREQAESMLMPLNIDVEFDLSSAQQHQNITPEIRQQLYLIFKEAINNIAKHSKATFVKVYFMQQGKRFCLRVENNHASEADLESGRGQGLKNMKMRAEKIQASCKVYIQQQRFVVEVCSE